MSRVWLDRFTDPHPISETSAFAVVGAFDPSLDRRVLVVAARDGVERALAAEALDRLAAAHRAPPHPAVAHALERVASPDGGGFVVFDFPARLDLETAVQIAAEAGWRTRLAYADGFTSMLREAMLATSAELDADGSPRCLGTLGLGNVLLAADGRAAILGYGHNVVCLDERGRLAPRGRFFQAAEVVGGAKPTAASDYIAMVKMSRVLLTFVELPEPVQRCLRGGILPEDRELARLLLRFETEVVHSTPAARPPIPDMLELSRDIRAALSTRDDPDGFREDVARLLAAVRPDLLGTPRTLRLAHDCAWVDCAGAELPVTPLLRRLLRVLASTRLERPGQVLSIDALIAAGWPGERVSYTSGRNRLHVALNGLRKLGLADELELESGGYRLRPSLRLELVHR